MLFRVGFVPRSRSTGSRKFFLVFDGTTAPLVLLPIGITSLALRYPLPPGMATLNGINCAACFSPASRRAPCNPRPAKRLMLRIFCLNSRKPSIEQARFGFGHSDKPPSGNIRFSGLDCGGKGIRTLDTLLRYTHFPGVLLRPLGHSSKIKNQCQKTKFGFDYQLFAPHSQLTGERLSSSQEPLLRVKVRIKICCVQHPCEFRRFCNPFAHKDHSVISPRIGVCR